MQDGEEDGAFDVEGEAPGARASRRASRQPVRRQRGSKTRAGPRMRAGKPSARAESRAARTASLLGEAGDGEAGGRGHRSFGAGRGGRAWRGCAGGPWGRHGRLDELEVGAVAGGLGAEEHGRSVPLHNTGITRVKSRQNGEKSSRNPKLTWHYRFRKMAVWRSQTL